MRRARTARTHTRAQTRTHTYRREHIPTDAKVHRPLYCRCYSDVPSSPLVPQCRPPLPPRFISLSLRVDLITCPSPPPRNTHVRRNALASTNGPYDRPATADSSLSDYDDDEDTPRGSGTIHLCRIDRRRGTRDTEETITSEHIRCYCELSRDTSLPLRTRASEHVSEQGAAYESAGGLQVEFRGIPVQTSRPGCRGSRQRASAEVGRYRRRGIIRLGDFAPVQCSLLTGIRLARARARAMNVGEHGRRLGSAFLGSEMSAGTRLDSTGVSGSTYSRSYHGRRSATPESDTGQRTIRLR